MNDAYDRISKLIAEANTLDTYVKGETYEENNYMTYLSDEEKESKMYTLDSLPQFSLDPIDEHENNSQPDDGINYKKDEDIIKFSFNNMEENNEIFDLDLFIGPSFEDYIHHKIT